MLAQFATRGGDLVKSWVSRELKESRRVWGDTASSCDGTIWVDIYDDLGGVGRPGTRAKGGGSDEGSRMIRVPVGKDDGVNCVEGNGEFASVVRKG